MQNSNFRGGIRYTKILKDVSELDAFAFPDIAFSKLEWHTHFSLSLLSLRVLGAGQATDLFLATKRGRKTTSLGRTRRTASAPPWSSPAPDQPPSRSEQHLLHFVELRINVARKPPFEKCFE